MYTILCVENTHLKALKTVYIDGQRGLRYNGVFQGRPGRVIGMGWFSFSEESPEIYLPWYEIYEKAQSEESISYYKNSSQTRTQVTIKR